MHQDIAEDSNSHDERVTRKRLSVLLVEDSESDALLILRQLRRTGFDIDLQVVQTGPEMAHALLSHPPDLVLSDFSLPGFSASAALRVLQATDLDIPFIVISGKIAEDEAIELMRTGAHDYLMKDALARLGPAVTREITEARMRAERRRSQQALRESEYRLRRLSTRILDAQEAERREISRELHDQIGQALTAVKLELQVVSRLFAQDAAAKRLASAVEITEEALAQVRSLSLNLRPPQLDYMGLEASLRWHAENQCARSDIALSFRSNLGERRFDSRSEIVCFRLMQEALTNLLRHARASRAEIVVGESDGFIDLSITDDGCGFDVESARMRMLEGESVGLLGMEERAALIDGSVDIQSAPGRGTCVSVRLPARQASEPEKI